VSIYASLPAPDGGHTDLCAIWVETATQHWESLGTCDCGMRNAPLVYQGSHHLPEAGDERSGCVDIACIPGHVRFYRDNPEADFGDAPETPEPFLRFGVNSETVVLEAHHVEQIVRGLREWLAEVRG
jgi:hypothetical protein